MGLIWALGIRAWSRVPKQKVEFGQCSLSCPNSYRGRSILCRCASRAGILSEHFLFAEEDRPSFAGVSWRGGTYRVKDGSLVSFEPLSD
jgi:hypothetical protein